MQSNRHSTTGEIAKKIKPNKKKLFLETFKS